MSANGKEPIIICDGVKKWFGDFQALRGVTTDVGEQEVVVVIGPSGSGKSTWIRCINRLEVHQEGRIIVDGIPSTPKGPHSVSSQSWPMRSTPKVLWGVSRTRR